MDLIFEPLWELNKIGVVHKNLKRAAGIYRESLLVPYVFLFPVDLDEMWAARCIPKNGVYSHVKLQVSKDQYTNPNVNLNALPRRASPCLALPRLALRLVNLSVFSMNLIEFNSFRQKCRFTLVDYFSSNQI